MQIKPLSPRHKVITGEKLVPGGQCLGHDENGRATMIWNCLPGETVQAFINKRRKGCAFGVADELVGAAAPERVTPMEADHYLSCSPWQILAWDVENRTKIQFAEEALHKLELPVKEIPLATTSEPVLHYRNKMEFSFARAEFKNDNSPLKLALFKRGSFNWKLPLDGCCLAEAIINSTGAAIVDWLNEWDAPLSALKTLIVRSDGRGNSVAALFVMERLPEFTEVKNLPLPDGCQGFRIYFSNPKSPASVADELLYEQGESSVTAELLGAELEFGLLSFFQVNIPMFKEALTMIGEHLDPSLPALDFYAGVGAISLPLARAAKDWHLVEVNAEAVEFAKQNISRNKLKNCLATCAPAEKITELITGKEQVIVDPPRAGMDLRVVERLNEVLPTKIIYLSCNLSTQARDLELLASNYKIVDLKLFNFFPRTPHVESLVVLERS